MINLNKVRYMFISLIVHLYITLIHNVPVKCLFVYYVI